MADEIEIVGLDKFLNKFKNAQSKLAETIAQSITISQQKIVDLAKERTPVDTGALQASGMVNPAEISGDMITCVGTFGGDDVDYALIVHEDLNVHHNTGQAKFFESASEELRDEVVQQLSVDVFKLVETG